MTQTTNVIYSGCPYELTTGVNTNTIYQLPGGVPGFASSVAFVVVA
jgi:hypothetical protein